MNAPHKKAASSVTNLGFQIAPMIDLVFVVMLYFMVMAASVKIEKAHNTKLPGGEGPVLADEVQIRIEDDGQVYLNDDPLDAPDRKNLSELTQNLTQLRQDSEACKSNLFVTIQASETSTYERIIDVLDALSVAKIPDVSFCAADLE